MSEVSGVMPQQGLQRNEFPSHIPAGTETHLDQQEHVYKEKISPVQREAMARCRVSVDAYMERVLTRGHATLSREEIQQWIEKKGRESGLVKRQTNELHAVAREYIRNNTRARELRDTHKDDRELIRVLTGMDVPRFARFSVRVGPWGLEITADDRTIQHMFNRGNPPSANFHAGGFAASENVPPYIFFKRQFFNKEILVHERQHVKYALNKNVIHRFHDEFLSTLGALPGDDSSTSYEETFMRMQRSFALGRAKDEIFAYYLGQGRFPLDLFKAEDGNPYDYLRFAREDGRTSRFDSSYRRASEKIFVQEYRQMLEAAVIRFNGLIQGGGYSSEQAIGLLVDVPLEQWETVIGEISAAKGYAQQTTIRNIPTRGWGTVSAQGKRVPLVDTVILPTDTQPNWYRESHMVDNEIKAYRQEYPDATLGEEITIKAAIISQLLYQRTRGAAEAYIKSIGLSIYFALLNEESKALSRSVHSGRPTDQQLSDARRSIFDHLRLYQSIPKSV